MSLPGRPLCQVKRRRYVKEFLKDPFTGRYALSAEHWRIETCNRDDPTDGVCARCARELAGDVVEAEDDEPA